MQNQVELEIKGDLSCNDNLEFLRYLGIDSKDFDEFNDDIDFDDCST